MKCQKCTKAATVHITEIRDATQIDDLHFCEECASKYLYEPQPKKAAPAKPVEEVDESVALGQRKCSVCGIKFVDFRNSGRLGCPHDYEQFAEDLQSLLENIHGDPRHVGKIPRRQPQARKAQMELLQLRKRLQDAIAIEAYEEAAQLRDRIRQIEET